MNIRKLFVWGLCASLTWSIDANATGLYSCTYAYGIAGINLTGFTEPEIIDHVPVIDKPNQYLIGHVDHQNGYSLGVTVVRPRGSVTHRIPFFVPSNDKIESMQMGRIYNAVRGEFENLIVFSTRRGIAGPPSYFVRLKNNGSYNSFLYLANPIWQRSQAHFIRDSSSNITEIVFGPLIDSTSGLLSVEVCGRPKIVNYSFGASLNCGAYAQIPISGSSYFPQHFHAYKHPSGKIHIVREDTQNLLSDWELDLINENARIVNTRFTSVPGFSSRDDVQVDSSTGILHIRRTNSANSSVEFLDYDLVLGPTLPPSQPQLSMDKDILSQLTGGVLQPERLDYGVLDFNQRDGLFSGIFSHYGNFNIRMPTIYDSNTDRLGFALGSTTAITPGVISPGAGAGSNRAIHSWKDPGTDNVFIVHANGYEMFLSYCY